MRLEKWKTTVVGVGPWIVSDMDHPQEIIIGQFRLEADADIFVAAKKQTTQENDFRFMTEIDEKLNMLLDLLEKIGYTAFSISKNIQCIRDLYFLHRGDICMLFDSANEMYNHIQKKRLLFRKFCKLT